MFSNHRFLVKINDSIIFSSHVRHLRTVRQQRKLPVPLTEKRLDIVIMGAPNAGKSVLLNTFLKKKLAATSRKKHTTRSEILGVFNHRNTQLVFYDTPGYATPEKTQALKKQVVDQQEVINNIVTTKADVVLLVIDGAKKLDDRTKYEFAEMVKIALKSVKQELVLVINKVDLVYPKTKLLDTTRTLVSLINGIKLTPEQQNEAMLDTTTFMISGMKNDGVLDLKNCLLSMCEYKPWLIKDKNNFTSLTDYERIEQIGLEAMLNNTHDEIPYIADIKCLQITPHAENKLKVYLVIKVDTPKQQRICVGHQGRTMLKMRQYMTSELEKIFPKQILVFIQIEIRGKNDDYESANETRRDNQVHGNDNDDDDDEEDDDDEIDENPIKQRTR